MSKYKPIEYVLGHEGPTLLDFKIDIAAFTVCVNAPGLLFAELELRTSLHLQDGCDYAAIRSLADGFRVTAVCGHKPPLTVPVRIGSSEVPILRIGLGPPTMYMTRLQFSTSGEETFAALCDRTLRQAAGSSYLVALVPVVKAEAGHGDHPSHDHHESMAALDDAIRLAGRYRIERVLEGRGR